MYSMNAQADVEKRIASDGLLRSQQTVAVVESHAAILAGVLEDANVFTKSPLFASIVERTSCSALQ